MQSDGNSSHGPSITLNWKTFKQIEFSVRIN